MTITAKHLAALERTLDGAHLWGLELDTRYRVAAATFEVSAAQHPMGPAVADRRLQVLLYPVGAFVAVLGRSSRHGLTVETFEVEQLVDIVETFEGATVASPLFEQPPPGPGEWGPEPSLQGKSSAGDGMTHSMTLHVTGEPSRKLDVRFTFDELTLRLPAGENLPLDRLAAH